MLHILTLTWNGLEMLAPLKDTIIPALKNIEYRWHIKDNGSSDDTADEVTAWSKSNSNIILHAYPDNSHSFSEGVNYLFKKSESAPDDFVMLLNNDVCFKDENSIRAMIKAFTDDVGVVGARLLYTGTDNLQHCGVVFDPRNSMPTHFRAGEPSDKRACLNRYFQAVTGAVSLTKARYLDGVCQTNKSGINGLDETYRWAFEDIDMCLAIAEKFNKKIVYCGRTNISHRESESLKKNPVNLLFMNHNSHHFKNKWFGKCAADKMKYVNDPKFGLIKE